MNARRRRAVACIVTIVLGLAATVPFGTSVAQSPDSDIQQLVAGLRSFQRAVRNDDLSDAGVERRARDMIALKRSFVLNTAGTNGADITDYFDLKVIDDRLEGTARRARNRAKASSQLARARTLTTQLAEELAQGDGTQAASNCLTDLAADQQELLEEIEAGSLTTRAIKKRARGLIDEKLVCIGLFPSKFDQNFEVVYSLLADIDERLEGIADAKDERKADVVDAITTALNRARELRNIVEDWDGPTQAPSTSAGTSTSTGSPTATSTSSPTATSTTSPTSTGSPSPSTSPSSTGSPGNNIPPSVSGIGASYDSGTHRTTYTVFASDQDADPLTYAWSKSNERQCGEFTPSGDTAVWNHSEPPCPSESSHPGTITVVVSDGHYNCTATYTGGSASGNGNPPDCVPK